MDVSKKRVLFETIQTAKTRKKLRRTTMKKLVAYLILTTLGASLMASAPIDLTKGPHTYTNSQGTTGLSYTVTDSKYYNRQKDDQGTYYDRYRAQTYFTTTSVVPEGKTLAVQFLGQEIEMGNKPNKPNWGNWSIGDILGIGGNGSNGYDPNFEVQDFGIYLYNPETGAKGPYLSAIEYKNYFDEKAGITADTSFGVYFVDKNGKYVTTTDNVVGNFDDDPHELTVYRDKDNPTYATKETTDKHFLCLFGNDYAKGDLNQTHWEFMLQTTLDDPYYPVIVIDGVDPHQTVGQPLPGTLATIMVSGLCAAALRRKNKKH